MTLDNTTPKIPVRIDYAKSFGTELNPACHVWTGTLRVILPTPEVMEALQHLPNRSEWMVGLYVRQAIPVDMVKPENLDSIGESMRYMIPAQLAAELAELVEEA